MMRPNDIENIFTYHSPHSGQNERYESIRAKAKEFALLVLDYTPDSAEQTIAIRKIQEAVMFANASIAITESSGI